MKCIYHQADFDGLCSAAIVRKKYPDVELIPHDYHLELDMSAFQQGEIVYLVDISLPLDQMQWLLIHHDLHWIDHHATAMADMADIESGIKIPGIREIGKAACELTWQYLFPRTDMPRPVWLLGRYDVWDLTVDESVELFQIGMKTYNNGIDDQVWNFVLNPYSSFVREVVQRGHIAQRFYANTMAKVCDNHAAITKWEGLQVIMMNTHEYRSQAFASRWPCDYLDAMVAYCRLADGRWKVSLYTDRPEIDVSVIAKKHGGGGHRGAAGFHCAELPWENSPRSGVRSPMSAKAVPCGTSEVEA